MTEPLFLRLFFLSFGTIGIIYLGYFFKRRSKILFSPATSKTVHRLRLRRSPAIYLGLMVLVTTLAILFFMLPAPTPVQAGIAAGFSEYYIPGSTDQLFRIFQDNDNDPELGNAFGVGVCNTGDCNQMHNVISIVLAADNVTVYYDHWENGYGTGKTGIDETFTGNRGDVLTFESGDIVVPRAPANTCTSTNPNGASTRCYDGRDRIYVAGGAVSVSQAFWPEATGTVYANAWEVYPIKPYQTSYTLPVGENLVAQGYTDFTQVFVVVQATQDGTSVQIDNPAVAGVEVNTTLNRGQVAELFHFNTGTTITASNPVQVQFIIGQPWAGQSSDSRSFTAVPNGLWSTSYYSPVPSAGAGTDVDLYIYNPTAAPLTINYQDSSGSGSFIVPASSTRSYQALSGHYVPANSAATLTAADSVTKFWAIGSYDTESANYNYGFTLVPPSQLTTEYFIAWAPGTTNLSANGSPVFVTPTQDNTTIFVDYSPADGIVDATFTLNQLQTQKLRDPADNDNTGMHIWATGPIAVVWGEDDTFADAGNPYIDAGYTILPLNQEWIDVVATLDKTSNPAVIPSAAGQVSTFTLVFTGTAFGLNDVTVLDTLPANWAYVANSTIISLPNGSTLSGNTADPDIAGQDLTWNDFPVGPLDMNPNETLTIQFQGITTGTPTPGYSINQASASGTTGGDTFESSDSATILLTPPATIAGQVRNDTDADGDLADPDSGIGGVTIVLYSDPNGDGDPADGVPILTTTTTITGGYVFTNVIPNSYVVVETDPSGFSSTADTNGPNDNNVGITVNPGQTSNGNDFLDTQPPGSVSGQVRNDTDADGDLADPDSGIDGVTIVLYSDPNGDGNPADGVPILTTTTTITGGYVFTNVIPGGYVVVETDPSGFSSTADTNGPNDNNVGVTVNPGQPSNGNDFLDTQPADLVINKSVTPISAAVGSVLTYTVIYTNNGPAAASNVALTDTLPAQVTFGSVVAETPPISGPTQSGQELVWTIPSLPSGGFGSLVFTVTVNSGASGTLINTAVITSSTTDTNPNNNNDDATTTIFGPAITIAKTPDLQIVQSGGTATFTITVTNTGDITLTNVTVADPLAPNCVAFIGLLAPKASSSYTCVLNNVTVDFTNIATATGTPPVGPDVTDNDPAAVDVISPGLAVDKSVNIARIAPNQIVTYTIRITNTGNITINPVRVTDTLSSGLTYQTGTANPTPSAINGQQLVWNDVTAGAGLTPGASTQITLLAVVTTTIGTYGNLAVVDGDYPGGSTPPVTDTVSTVVEDPSLDLDKEVVTPGVVGDLITFTIRITNTGPSTLDQVPLFDAFTGPVEYVGGTPPADIVDQTNQQLAWNDLTTFFGNLAPGQSIVVTTIFHLITTDPEFSMTNTARVTDADDVFNNQANDDQDTEILTNVPTAIDLLYFTSQQAGGFVELRWATAVEYDNYGFRLLRSTSGNIADAIEIGFVAGKGQGTVSGSTYTFTDESVTTGQTYTYWLVDVDFNGVETAHAETTSINLNAGGGGTSLYLPLILK